MSKQIRKKDRSGIPHGCKTTVATHVDEEEKQRSAVIALKSPNEIPISVSPAGLEPHVRVVRPARPSLIYERVE